jgi:DNA-directed RNA polymerase specialized sigma24 family protein
VTGPRAYLFRIATNLCIDQMRRRELNPSDVRTSPDPPTGDRSIEALEAASVLMSRVAPQERAAVVLKEVFDFTLQQIAEILSTTVGRLNPRSIAGARGWRETRACRVWTAHLPRNFSNASSPR